MSGKYMAYVGSYSYNGTAKGITVYDVDVKKGNFTKRCEVAVDNSSYVIASNSKKTLYSIADEGVVAFRIHENGSITRLNSANIKGMRGCHLSTDPDDQYIFVSGYHDGKATMLKLNEDGSLGPIVAGIYHQGLGSVAERNFRPHISCTRLTPDQKFIMVADLGIDQVKIYRHQKHDEGFFLVDSIRCELESAPRSFRFSADGKFMYLMYELKNTIDVFTYETGERAPKFEKIQTVSTTCKEERDALTAACVIRFSKNGKYLFCSNAGDDTVTVFERDLQTGLLKDICCLPISGEYPKDLAVFPDDKHIACINHESGSITFFSVDYENGLLVMNGKEIKVNEPNSCVIVKVSN